ncbi:Probable cyanate hydratase (Cyanase) [Mycobacteroides abscessus subsp. abscessus]|nr:Probable cyanate hydratase (Cyanase) [Mycobacteroides abscessus subsp. abscessus]SLD05389.1 Probable cyanate hydratase (Cyanase) [Mycobacteroides abscessus subsp. abscessus]
MVHAQFDPTSREELAIAAVEAKIAKDLSWQQIADAAGYSPAFVTAAVLGQHPLPPRAADTVAGLLGLGDDAALLLQTIPTRGSIPSGWPRDSCTSRGDPTIHLLRQPAPTDRAHRRARSAASRCGDPFSARRHAIQRCGCSRIAAPAALPLPRGATDGWFPWPGLPLPTPSRGYARGSCLVHIRRRTHQR